MSLRNYKLLRPHPPDSCHFEKWSGINKVSSGCCRHVAFLTLDHLWCVFYRELYKLNLLFHLLKLLVFVLTTIYALLAVYLLYKPDNQKDSKKYHRSKVATLVPGATSLLYFYCIVPDPCLGNGWMKRSWLVVINWELQLCDDFLSVYDHVRLHIHSTQRCRMFCHVLPSEKGWRESVNIHSTLVPRW